MGALGYVMNVPEEEKYLESKQELRNNIVGLLGGRAAEEIFFGDVTTGASNDIEKATAIAQNMITRFGMSERFGLMGLATVESQYLEGNNRYTCSYRTVADLDTEVMNLLKECYEEAKKMISENRDVMDVLAAHLLEKETITGKEFMKIFRAEKGLPEPEENGSDDTKSAGSESEGTGSAVEESSLDNTTIEDKASEAADNAGSDHLYTEDPSDDRDEPRWMPPTPGPDREKDGTPVGRFSNLPIV